MTDTLPAHDAPSTQSLLDLARGSGLAPLRLRGRQLLREQWLLGDVQPQPMEA